MSTNPLSVTSPSSAADARPRDGVKHAFLWLAVIFAVGLCLRVYPFTRGFQVEEFVAVAAVAERTGAPAGQTVTEATPLVPVANLDEVSKRSVIPYGIRDPHPLYHNVLYGVIQILPVADWSLRLPSLLAGLACIGVVFWLTRSAFGTEVALVASAFVALDPIQITLSWNARPFALANLACLLSFVALWGLVQTSRIGTGVLCAFGYALSVAFAGYLSPVILLAVAGHLGMMVYSVLMARREGIAWRLGLWLLGVVGAGLLVLPEVGYWQQLYAWGQGHTDYLLQLHPLRLFTPLLLHNGVLLGGLLLILVASSVIRWQVEGEGEKEETAAESGAPSTGSGSTGVATVSTAPPSGRVAAPAREAVKETVAEEGEPLPENDEVVWLSRFWVFLPQLAVVLVAFGTAQSIIQSSYFGYTTLGAAVVLAYFATRDRSREVRLGVSAVVCLALLASGFFPEYATGQGLYSNGTAKTLMTNLNTRMGDSWKEGDVLLMQSSLLEMDFVRNDIPEENRDAVQRIALAPLTTLYVDSISRPVIALTLSQSRGEGSSEFAGRHMEPSAFYNDALTARLRQYKRYWMTGLASGRVFNSRPFLANYLPWMANALECDLILARERDRTKPYERYVEIPMHVQPTDGIDGLSFGYKDQDFPWFVHLVRPKQPGSVFALGALSQVGMPNAHVTIPSLLGSQHPTPRLRRDPELVGSGE